MFIPSQLSILQKHQPPLLTVTPSRFPMMMVKVFAWGAREQ
jgi:hypothetical protein